jgi:N-acetylmuramoyl-L-alanine amidase
VLKLCINAGHGNGNIRPGMYDPGAVANGITEADVALMMAKSGQWVLGRMGIDVFLTRDDDSDATRVDLLNELAEREGCTHFLSLHMNAGGWLATGTETFFRPAGALNRDFARAVQGSALEAFELRNRGLKTEGQSQHPRLAVLDFKTGPAALLEMGFITNRGDLNRVLDRNRRIEFWTRFGYSLVA